MILNEAYDGISKEKNQKLYDILASKVIEGIYSVPFSSVNEVLKNGYEIFDKLEEEEQVKVLLTLVLLLKTGRGGNCDLSLIGGKSKMGSYRMSSKLSNWKKKFSDVRIVNVSSSGIFEAKSINLLELLE